MDEQSKKYAIRFEAWKPEMFLELPGMYSDLIQAAQMFLTFIGQESHSDSPAYPLSGWVVLCPVVEGLVDVTAQRWLKYEFHPVVSEPTAEDIASMEEAIRAGDDTLRMLSEVLPVVAQKPPGGLKS
jgi:hypothetical protein